MSELDLTGAFDHAAGHYDLMVGLNPGYHDHLRAAASTLLERIESGEVLDLGCGSGASTKALLNAGAQTVLGVDASAGMLAQARAKSWPPGVRFAHTRAEELDTVANGFRPQGAFAAYLFRNLEPEHRDEVLATVHERLPDGGWLVVQDYAFNGERLAAARWSAVCWTMAIPLAAVLLRDTTLYRYLWRSVRRFDSTHEFTERLVAAGFTDVAVRTVPGWQHGILHTFTARKAESI